MTRVLFLGLVAAFLGLEAIGRPAEFSTVLGCLAAGALLLPIDLARVRKEYEADRQKLGEFLAGQKKIEETLRQHADKIASVSSVAGLRNAIGRTASGQKA